MDSNALVPVEQAIVPFYGSKIFGFRLSDERMVASLNSFCKMLKLAKHGQMERIRRDEDLAKHLLVIIVETPNGSQHVDVLEIEAVRLWVMGLQVNLIAPEKRPLVKALREHAYEVLSRALLKPEAGQAAQTTPGPEAEASQAGPARGRSGAAGSSGWERLFGGLDDIQEVLDDVQGGLDDVRGALDDLRREEQLKAGRLVVVEEWLTSLDRRVAAAGQGGAGEIDWLPALSGAHLADLRALLRVLEQATGRAEVHLKQEMIEAFGVSAINAIPDEQWEDVLAWCLWRTRQPG